MSIGFFAPGPLELLIVGLFVLVPLVVTAIVLNNNRKSTRSYQRQDDLIECPECGEWIGVNDVTCRFCNARVGHH